MATKQRAPRDPNAKILQRLTGIQGSLVRIEQWLARIAAVRIHPPSAERAPKLLKREEVFTMLGITPRALYTRIRRGRFPRPTFAVGRRSLWREEDVFRGRGQPGDERVMRTVQRRLTLSPDHEPLWDRLYAEQIRERWAAMLLADKQPPPGPDTLKGLVFFGETREEAEHAVKVYLGCAEPVN